MKLKEKCILLFTVFSVCCLMAAEGFAAVSIHVPFESNPPTLTTVYTGAPFTPAAYPVVYGISVPGVPGNGLALHFNGNGSIKVPNSAALNFGSGDFAVTFWVKTKSKKTNNTVTDKRVNGTRPGYHVTIYRGHPLLRMQSTAGGMNYWNSSPGSKTVNDGEWHHVAIYVDRDQKDGGKIYIDGLLDYTFNPTKHMGKSLDNKAPLLIAGHALNPRGFSFVGKLDELWQFKQ